MAVLPGTDRQAKAVLMLGHIDVVNARREDWARDPFVMIEEGGEFYGRGVSDMKAQDAIWADSMVRYHAEGYRPKRTIKMALTCGEEPGDFVNGAGWLAKNQRELIDAGLSLSEGGGGDLDAKGNKLAITVMAAEKTSANFTFEITGPGGHSSKPRPDNVITALGKALGNLDGLKFPTEVNGFTRAYLTALAPRVDAETGAAIRRLLADPQDAAANAMINKSVSWNAMLRTTCIPTLLEGGACLKRPTPACARDDQLPPAARLTGWSVRVRDCRGREQSGDQDHHHHGRRAPPAYATDACGDGADHAGRGEDVSRRAGNANAGNVRNRRQPSDCGRHPDDRIFRTLPGR